MTDSNAGREFPTIYNFAQVTSTFDIAINLAAEGSLAIWDSILAASQTAGRGQLRRHWQSPPGNIYATIRLPQQYPFSSTAASLAVGVLCACALKSYNINVAMKWPNDLVLFTAGTWSKVGGILLEDRQDLLLAGVGLNLHQAPTALRPDAAMGATSLAMASENNWPAPPQLWRDLVKKMLLVYKTADFFAACWQDKADDLLLWRGKKVQIRDGAEPADAACVGIFRGINAAGGAILDTDLGREEIFYGSMYPLE